MTHVPTPRRNFRPLVKWLAGMLAVGLLAGGLILVLRKDSVAPNASQQQLIDQAIQGEREDTETIFRIAVDPDDLSQAQGLDPSWKHILLLGTDGWESKLNGGRSDAMMVLSYNEQAARVRLSTLVRDMLVPIPGASRGDRINTANAYGGPLLAVKTVNEVLGLDISRYCSVNFVGFTRVVDTLGGVTLTLGEGEARLTASQITDKPQLLTGTQALDYVRIRRLDNNFGRNQRQLDFVDAMLRQLRQQDRGTLMQAFSESLGYLATNLTAEELLGLLRLGLNSGLEVAMQTLPSEGHYGYGQAPSGNNGVTFNEDALRDAFHQFVYGTADSLALLRP